MKKAYTLISAAAIAAVMAVPAVANDLPLNNVVSGGQGEETVEGGALFLGGLGAAGAAVAAVVVAIVATVATADDEVTTTN